MRKCVFLKSDCIMNEYARMSDLRFSTVRKETNLEPQINADEHRYETRFGICVHPCVSVCICGLLCSFHFSCIALFPDRPNNDFYSHFASFVSFVVPLLTTKNAKKHENNGRARGHNRTNSKRCHVDN